MNIMVFDTETTNLEKPFCYNIGYVIYDTEAHEVRVKRDFVVEQVWHNTMLFTTAYYADKRDLYINRMRARTVRMEKFGYITQQMYRDITDFEIAHAYAYNSPFDVRVFEYNCDWFKCINPFDSVAIHDIRGYVHKRIAWSEDFQNFCDTYEQFTESGNYSTTAETVYRYLTGNVDFIEEHTALADSEIELMILCQCIEQNCEWNEDYKVYRSICKNEVKQFEIIDAYGNSHTFDYTSKRKFNNDNGLRFTIKQRD
jgi:hypothetical protein